MRKSELAESVQLQLKTTTKNAADLVESVFELVRLQLEKGDDVKLPGFGNFLIRQKRQRIGRNPKTGEAVPITKRKVVTFKASQVLRDRVK